MTAKACPRGQMQIKGKCRYPERYAVYYKLGKGKYQRHTWPLTKWEAEKHAKRIEKIAETGEGFPFEKIAGLKVKKLSNEEVKKEVIRAKKISPHVIPDSVKELIYLW